MIRVRFGCDIEWPAVMFGGPLSHYYSNYAHCHQLGHWALWAAKSSSFSAGSGNNRRLDAASDARGMIGGKILLTANGR